MLYWLADLSSTLSIFNVFRYLTVRTAGSMITALVFVFMFGPVDHRSSAAAPGQGPADPRRRAEIAYHHQGRHADHGRADDPARHRRLDAAVGQSAQSLRLDRARGDARLRPGRVLRRLSEGDAADPQRLCRLAAARDRGRASRSPPASRSRAWAGRPFATSLVFPVFKELVINLGWFFPIFGRLHHRRRRQRREPDRRARRARHRPGDDRVGELRRDLLSRRQRGVLRLSADPFRARHRRACRGVRRGDRRGPRLSLVQRAAGLDLHGRHRLAGARRPDRLGRGRDQARDRARHHRRACSCSKRCR